MRKALKTVKGSLEHVQPIGPKDVFHTVAEEWIEHHENTIKALAQRHLLAIDKVDHLKAYLGEDPKVTSQVLFARLLSFTSSFARASIDNPKQTILKSKWALILARHRDTTNPATKEEVIEMEKKASKRP